MGHWRGTHLQFKTLSQTPAEAARLQTRGQCVVQLPIYFPAFASTDLYYLVTEAHGCEKLALSCYLIMTWPGI